MKLKQPTDKTARPCGYRQSVSNHCFGILPNYLRPQPLLALAFAVTVALVTSCSSTGTKLSARLISPTSTSQKTSNSEDDNWYQPPRSPAFNDLFGS
jgi:hypothetical protein